MKSELIELDINEIKVNEKPKRNLGDTITLENSIKKLGVLHPVIVDPDNRLISGYRRLEACRKSGIKHIPAMRVDAPATSMIALDIQSDENLCRLPLSADELHEHIQLKKNRLAGKPESTGFFAGIKKIMGLN